MASDFLWLFYRSSIIKLFNTNHWKLLVLLDDCKFVWWHLVAYCIQSWLLCSAQLAVHISSYFTTELFLFVLDV
jgi:hypothetical protein